MGFDFLPILIAAIGLDSIQSTARKPLDSEAAIVEFAPNLRDRSATLEPPLTGSKTSKALSIFTGIVLACLPNRTELLADPCLVRDRYVAPSIAEVVCRRALQVVRLTKRVILPDEVDGVNKGSGLNCHFHVVIARSNLRKSHPNPQGKVSEKSMIGEVHRCWI